MLNQATVLIPILKMPVRLNPLWRRPIDLFEEEELTLEPEVALEHLAPTYMSLSHDESSTDARRAIERDTTRNPACLVGYGGCLRIQFGWSDSCLALYKEELKKNFPDVSDVEAQWKYELMVSVRLELRALATCLDLALPGAWPQERAYLILSPDWHEVAPVYGWLQTIYDKPALEFDLEPKLELAAVWNRLNKSAGFRSGFARTRFEKALACYCNLYSEQRSRERMTRVLWSCAGLEGFYSDNLGGATTLICSRLPLVVGPGINPAGLRKAMGDIYKLRSSTLHGQRGLHSPISGDHYDKYNLILEEAEAEDVAILLLSETIRAAINKDLDDPRFERALVQS